jgi:hypothetical protein
MSLSEVFDSPAATLLAAVPLGGILISCGGLGNFQ